MSFYSKIKFDARIENDTLYIKNFSVSLEEEIKSFDIGIDGLPYAIFRDNCYTYEYSDATNSGSVVCWDGYENCVCLQDTIGL